MMEPWQKMSLPPPPVQTCKVEEKIEIKELEHVCNNITRVLTKQSPLHKESALLSRFLYKYDKKFRNDIGYRNIRKAYSTLKKYLQLNLLKDVENFVAVLPQDDDDHFPTRQMLEYLMSRIIAFAKIMMRLFVCSKQAAIFYFDRIKRGESHWMSLMPYALLSRLCYLCSVLLHHSTSWYSCLYSYLNLLQAKGLMFLPAGYQLPVNLEQWLDLKNLECFGRFNWTCKKIIDVDSSLLDDEETSTFDNILGLISKINEDKEDAPNETPNKQNNTFLLTSLPKTDCGEVVSRQNMLIQSVQMDCGTPLCRDSVLVKELDGGESISRENIIVKRKDYGDVYSESINMLSDFQKKMKRDKGSHYFEKVTNLKSLTEFIDKEEIYRNNEDKKSLTSHLSFMQWQTLKTSLIKVCDVLSKSRKVEKKIKKVWKEKCSDYL